jgi:hypothetical protein
MTVAELDDRITPGELTCWAALFEVEEEEAAEARRRGR